jgi:hypothetical protein
VLERSQDPGLPLEAGEMIRIAREGVREHLDRDVPPEPRVARAIDLAHAAGAERREDFVGTESGSRREAQGFGSDFARRSSRQFTTMVSGGSAGLSR